MLNSGVHCHSPVGAGLPAIEHRHPVALIAGKPAPTDLLSSEKLPLPLWELCAEQWCALPLPLWELACQRLNRDTQSPSSLASQAPTDLLCAEKLPLPLWELACQRLNTDTRSPASLASQLLQICCHLKSCHSPVGAGLPAIAFGRHPRAAAPASKCRQRVELGNDLSHIKGRIIIY